MNHFSYLFCTIFGLTLTQQTLAASVSTQVNPTPKNNESVLPWWKTATIYQVYLRSFADANGDGIGDIPGLIRHIDYLKTLGVDTIWISPHYDSPNIDNGYDVRDFKKISSDYGKMADFDRLIHETKKRKMHVIIDFILNHTSDQHQWFIDSQKSLTNTFRDYYIWRNPINGKPPNNYLSFFDGSAWEYQQKTKQYYLHYFTKQQPDLNWDNPAVRGAMHANMRFWLDKGVSGMRLDSVPTISKPQQFIDLRDLNHFGQYYAQGPNLHRYIQELHHEVLRDDQIFTVGELFGVDYKHLGLFIAPERQEINAAIDSHLIDLDHDKKNYWKHRDWQIREFRQIIQKLDNAIGERSWKTFFLTNHDNSRMISRYGRDSGPYRELSAKALATILLTQRATPILYQGDEIGMTNYPFSSINEFQDVSVLHLYDRVVKKGNVSPDFFVSQARLLNRDNARTPFQWDSSKNAGFTRGKPWFHINNNYRTINADAQLNDPNSIFRFYRQLIALRQQRPTLIIGKYRDVDLNNNTVYAYTRTGKQDVYLVTINMTDHPQRFYLPKQSSIIETLLQNSGQEPSVGATQLLLGPWQSGIYRLLPPKKTSQSSQ